MTERNVKTSDGKIWIYDFIHHKWIDVSIDNSKLKKLSRNSVRVK
jgi:hypothetical protein